MTEISLNQVGATNPKHLNMIKVGTIFKHIGNFDNSLYILSQVSPHKFGLISIEENSGRWNEPHECETTTGDDWELMYISKKDFDIITDNQTDDFAEVISINIDYVLK